MIAEQLETLRAGILLQLNAAYPDGMTENFLFTNAKVINRLSGLTLPVLQDQLMYLEREKLIRRTQRAVKTVRQEFTITDQGRTWLDEMGLLNP